jgi:hypothetical protein
MPTLSIKNIGTRQADALLPVDKSINMRTINPGVRLLLLCFEPKKKINNNNNKLR